MALSDDQITQIRERLERTFGMSLSDAWQLLALVDQLRSERDRLRANHDELSRRLTTETTKAVTAEASLARLRTALEGLAERWDEDAKGATGFPSACAGELRDALASTRPAASPKESTTP